jgi:hypothetical protein
VCDSQKEYTLGWIKALNMRAQCVYSFQGLFHSLMIKGSKIIVVLDAYCDIVVGADVGTNFT